MGLHSDKIDGGKLFGDDPTYHGTLFSVFSQSDATHRLLLSWMALGLMIVVFVWVLGLLLKRKDIRG